MAVEWESEDIVNLEHRRLVSQLESTVEVFQERIAELEFAQEDIGWTRLGGEAQYEFSRSHLRSMIARARLYFLQNPLIRRGVTIQADYVFAQGLNIQGTNDLVNKVIQDFIEDPGNRSEFTDHSAHLMMEQTQLIDGNQFFVLFTDKLDTGAVKIRSIIVDEITQIISDPNDANVVQFYKREWVPVDEDGRALEQRAVYYPDIDYMPKDVLKLDSSRNGIPIQWDAPILHVKTGALKKSKFGAPEIYSALDWAKSHSKLLADWATIIAMYARLALKVTVPGGKNSVAAARTRLQTGVGAGGIVETNPATTAGAIFIKTKDGADVEPIKTSGATTSAKDARELRIMVAAAMGLPDPMLSGEVDVGNLATAKTLDRPTELKFRSRQQIWEEKIQKVIDWVIRWAIEAQNGPLRPYVQTTVDSRGRRIYKPKNDPKTKKPIDLHVEVVFPPILEHTIQERIEAIVSAVTLNGKTVAIDSPELKKLTIRLTLQALGLADVDELVDLIFAGMSDEELKDKNPDGQDKNNGREPQTRPTEPEPTEIRV